jgi:hypothetical protein
MSVKIEKSFTTKLNGKGILKQINSDGFLIQDVKEGTIELLAFNDVQQLIGKEVSISISNKESD